MLETSAIRKQGVFQFHGAAHVSKKLKCSTTRQPLSQRGWPTRFRLPLTRASREYVVVHADTPFISHTMLYALKRNNHLAHACLELHSRSELNTWTESTHQGPVYFLSLTGYEQHEHDAQWVIRLEGDQEEANRCSRRLQGILRRISYLDHEFRHGDGVKLYTNPESPPSPQTTSKVAWLLGTSEPLSEPLGLSGWHNCGVVPRRAELTSPVIDAYFNELLASLEPNSLPTSLHHVSDNGSDSSEDSPLLAKFHNIEITRRDTILPPASGYSS